MKFPLKSLLVLLVLALPALCQPLVYRPHTEELYLLQVSGAINISSGNITAPDWIEVTVAEVKPFRTYKEFTYNLKTKATDKYRIGKVTIQLGIQTYEFLIVQAGKVKVEVDGDSVTTQLSAIRKAWFVPDEGQPILPSLTYKVVGSSTQFNLKPQPGWLYIETATQVYCAKLQ